MNSDKDELKSTSPTVPDDQQDQKSDDVLDAGLPRRSPESEELTAVTDDQEEDLEDDED